MRRVLSLALPLRSLTPATPTVRVLSMNPSPDLVDDDDNAEALSRFPDDAPPAWLLPLSATAARLERALEYSVSRANVRARSETLSIALDEAKTAASFILTGPNTSTANPIGCVVRSPRLTTLLDLAASEHQRISKWDSSTESEEAQVAEHQGTVVSEAPPQSLRLKIVRLSQLGASFEAGWQPQQETARLAPSCASAIAEMIQSIHAAVVSIERPASPHDFDGEDPRHDAAVVATRAVTVLSQALADVLQVASTSMDDKAVLWLDAVRQSWFAAVTLWFDLFQFPGGQTESPHSDAAVCCAAPTADNRHTAASEDPLQVLRTILDVVKRAELVHAENERNASQERGTTTVRSADMVQEVLVSACRWVWHWWAVVPPICSVRKEASSRTASDLAVGRRGSDELDALLDLELEPSHGARGRRGSTALLDTGAEESSHSAAFIESSIDLEFEQLSTAAAQHAVDVGFIAAALAVLDDIAVNVRSVFTADFKEILRSGTTVAVCVQDSATARMLNSNVEGSETQQAKMPSGSNTATKAVKTDGFLTVALSAAPQLQWSSLVTLCDVAARSHGGSVVSYTTGSLFAALAHHVTNRITATKYGEEAAYDFFETATTEGLLPLDEEAIGNVVSVRREGIDETGQMEKGPSDQDRLHDLGVIATAFGSMQYKDPSLWAAVADAAMLVKKYHLGVLISNHRSRGPSERDASGRDATRRDVARESDMEAFLSVVATHGPDGRSSEPSAVEALLGDLNTLSSALSLQTSVPSGNAPTLSVSSESLENALLETHSTDAPGTTDGARTTQPPISSPPSPALSAFPSYAAVSAALPSTVRNRRACLSVVFSLRQCGLEEEMSAVAAHFIHEGLLPAPGAATSGVVQSSSSALLPEDRGENLVQLTTGTPVTESDSYEELGMKPRKKKSKKTPKVSKRLKKKYNDSLWQRFVESGGGVE